MKKELRINFRIYFFDYFNILYLTLKCILNSLLLSAMNIKTFCELMRRIMVIMQDLQQASDIL